MFKRSQLFFDLFLLLIITIPTFISILNNQYFTIHDNQHVVRLYLLDQGIKQGYLYPRWVDRLTFGFGDPLFNFYPPLVYYLGEFFHLLGFSLIWSIKIVFILGFLIAGFSMYFLASAYLGRLAGILASTVYTYSFYHSVNAYVRGALSEFFTMSLLPLVFLSFYKLSKNINLKNSLFFGFSLALIILTHQLIALPLIFFLFFYFLYYIFRCSATAKFIKYLGIGSFFGLGLSAFYWLPMFIEKKFTFLDMELGGYKLHYLYPYQFWYSPWGYGGSVPGPNDGMTFQLGKVPILLIFFSSLFFLLYFFQKRIKKDKVFINHFIFFVSLSFFGLWMSTGYSDFIWRNLKLLWNLQFPWRFLAVTNVFISLVAGFGLVFLEKLLTNFKSKQIVLNLVTFFFTFLLIFKYSPYFRPQSYLNVTDQDLLTSEEIEWVQSKTVLHFVPKGVKAKKNEFGVYVLDIEKNNLPKNIFEIKKGEGKVKILQNKFQEKKFFVTAQTPLVFQLNTFDFVGWQAYLNKTKIPINDQNDYRLITVFIPQGEHQLKFLFQDTPVRKIAKIITAASFIFLLIPK